jgi:hypothetical protein
MTHLSLQENSMQWSALKSAVFIYDRWNKSYYFDPKQDSEPALIEDVRFWFYQSCLDELCDVKKCNDCLAARGILKLDK